MPRPPLYLAEVHWIGWRGLRRAAQLLPVAVASEDRHAWAGVYPHGELSAHFPNVGLVSWLDPPDELRHHSFWLFERAEQPTYDPNIENRDRYMVVPSSVRPAAEVIDVVRLGGEPRGRELLTSDGVSLPPSAGTAYFLRDAGELWLNNVRLVPHSTAGLWVIDPTFSDQPRQWVECDQPEAVLAVGGDQPRLFLAPDAIPRGRVRLRDWSPDGKFLRHVVGHLRKWGVAQADVREAERAVERLRSLLDGTRQAGGSLEFERERAERARSLLSGLHDLTDVAAAAEQLLDAGPLAEELQRRKEVILQEERERARRAAEAEFEGKREELRRVEEVITRKTTELSNLDEAIRCRKEELDHALDRLDAEQSKRLEEIRSAPEKFLASAGILRTLALSGPPVGSAAPWPVGADSPKRATLDPAARPYTDVRAFMDEVTGQLLERDSPAGAAPLLHAAFVSGSVPFLFGSRARDILEAYAQALNTQESLWLPVSPTWLHPSDLLSPAGHRGGLAAFLSAAEAAQGLRLVVLEGVNQAAIDSLLLPLLSSAAASRDRDAGSAPSLIMSSDGGIRQVRWPRKVLLAATLVDGATKIAVPTGTWASSVLIMCDLLEHHPPASPFANRHPSLRAVAAGTPRHWVPFELLDGWRRTSQSAELVPCIAAWNSLQTHCRLPRAVRDTFLRTFAALRASGNDEGVSLGQSLALAILPLLASSPAASKMPLDALTSASLPYQDAKAALGEIARILG